MKSGSYTRSHRLFALVAVLVGLPVALHGDSDWTRDIVVSEVGVAHSITMTFGVHPDGTDGLDLGEVGPPPPIGFQGVVSYPR